MKSKKHARHHRLVKLMESSPSRESLEQIIDLREEIKGEILAALESGGVLPLQQIAAEQGLPLPLARLLLSELEREGKVLSGSCGEEWVSKGPISPRPRLKLVAHLKEQIERDPEAYARGKMKALADRLKEVL